MLTLILGLGSFFAVASPPPQPPSFLTQGLASVGPEGHKRMDRPILFVHGVGMDAHDWGIEWAFDRCQAPVAEIETIGQAIPAAYGSSLVPENLVGFIVKAIGYQFDATGSITCKDHRVFRWSRTFGGFNVAQYKYFQSDEKLPYPKKELPTLTLTNGVVHASPSVSPPFQIKRILEEEWGAKTSLRDEEWEGKPQNLSPRGLDDLVMGYKVGGTPRYLASQYDLDVEFSKENPASGINKNGLYFYSSKKSEGCPNEKWMDIVASLELKVGYWKSEVNQPPMPNFYYPSLSMAGQISAFCPENGRTIVVPVLERVLEEIQEKVAYDISNWSNAYRNRQISYDANSKTVSYSYSNSANAGPTKQIAFDAQQYFSSNAQDFKVTAMDGFLSPRWELGNFGQAGQLYTRLIEVLDDFYGKGNWKGNPSARVDIVAHSQGGVVAREMIRGASLDRATDVDNPIAHLGHVITLGTPHLGSAVATSADRVIEGHASPINIPGAPDASESFPTLGMLRARLGSDEWMSIAQGRLRLEWTPKAKFALHMATLATANYGIPFNALSEIHLPDLDLEISSQHLIERVRVSGRVLGIQAFSEVFPVLEDMDRVNAMFKAGDMAWTEESAFLDRLRSAEYPKRPDGSWISFTSLYSKNAGMIVDPVFQRVPDMLTEQTCKDAVTSFNLPWYADVLAATFVGPLADMCNGGVPGIVNRLDMTASWMDWGRTMSNFDLEWSQRGDFVVENTSQRGADIYRIPYQGNESGRKWNDADGMWNGDFFVNEKRPLLMARNPYFSSRDFFRGTVRHGDFSVPTTDGTCLDGFAQMNEYLDIEQALKLPPTLGAAPAALPLYYGVGNACAQQRMISDGTPGTYDGTAHSFDLDGDFSIKTALRTDGTLSAARAISVVEQPGDRVTIHQSNSSGTRLEICRAGICDPSTVLSPSMAEEVSIQRQGADWVVGARFGQTWSRRAFQAKFSKHLMAQLITAYRGRAELLKEPILEGDRGASVQGAVPAGSMVAQWRESKPDAVLSRLEMRFHNIGEVAVEGFKASFWIHTDAPLVPVAESWWLAGGRIETRVLPNGWTQVMYETNATVEPGTIFPDSNGIQIGLHDRSYRPWRLVSPSGIPGNDWSMPEGMVVRDMDGRDLAGNAPDLGRFASKLGPELLVLSGSPGNDSNLGRVRVQLENHGDGGLGAFTAQYWLSMSVDQKPVLETYFVSPECHTGLTSHGNRAWSVDLSCSNLEPAGTRTFLFGLHAPDWSQWDPVQEVSGNGSSLLQNNDKIPVLLPDGFVVHGQVPLPGESSAGADTGNSDAGNEVNLPSGLELTGQRLEYGNQTHVRLAVWNRGTDNLQGFLLRYKLEPGAADPVLETPYLAGCSANLDTTVDPHHIVVDCSGQVVAPGSVFPDPSGMLFWMHRADWSAYSGASHKSVLGPAMSPINSVDLSGALP